MTKITAPMGTLLYIRTRKGLFVNALVCLTQFSLPFKPGCGHFPIFEMVSY